MLYPVLHGQLGRRALLRRAARLGLGAPSVMALLAACTTSSSSPSASSGAPSAATAPPAGAAAGAAQPTPLPTPAAGNPKPNTVTANLWESIPPETEKFWLGQQMPAFYQQHPEANIVTRQLGNEDPAKIRAGLTAGGDQAPAMAWIASSETGAYVEGNVLADVDSWLNAKPNLKSDLLPSLVQLSTYQGKVRSLPWMSNNCAMWLNLDAFSAAGVPVPSQDPEKTWTWEEFADAVKKLTSADRKGYLVSVGGTWDTWLFHAWIAQAGGQFLTEEGDPKFNEAPGVEAATFIKSLVDGGSTAFSEPNKGSDAGPWYAGKVAIITNGPWNFPTLSKFTQFKFTVVPYPRHKQPATNLGGDQLFIFERGQQVNNVSFAFAEYMLSPEFQTAFNIQSGNLPVVKSASSSQTYQDYLKQYPFMAGWNNQTAYGVQRQPVPQYNDVATIFSQAWDDIMLKGAGIQDRLNQAAQQASALKR